MRMRVIPLISFALLTCLAAQAFATGTKYPPGPGGVCLDTVTIQQIQNGATCRPPAVGTGLSNTDTSYVYGVKGIITGIKNNGTSRTFYMQNRRSNPSYTGVDVFNGNGLYNPNIQIGDSVSVTGKVEEGFSTTRTGPGLIAESGETEITVVNSTTNLPTMILSSGNSLPAFHQLSIADIRFPAVDWNSSVPNASFATGEPWESALVKVTGPLIVGLRVYQGATTDIPTQTYATYPGIEVRSPGGGGFLCYREGFPGDSIYVDMTGFVTITPPTVGTKIDSLFGILQQGGRSGASGVVAWRIALRSAPPSYSNASTPDLYLATPPNVATAFSVANDSVKIIFDRPVTAASATVPGHYSLLTSERGVDYVHMVGNNAVVIHAVGAYADGATEVVSSNQMTGLTNGLTQTTPQSKTFINGVLSIAEIQAADPAFLGVCEDRSKYSGPALTDGPRLTFKGVATGRFFTREYYMQDEVGGPRSGIKVFQPGDVLEVGHKYLISGNVTEFNGETEVNAPPYVEDLGVGTIPLPINLPMATIASWTCDATSTLENGEDYEGCLVNVTSLLATRYDALIAGAGGFFHVSDAGAAPDTSVQIEIDATAAPGRNWEQDEYLLARGILSYRFAQAVLFPRNDGDLRLSNAGGTVGVDDPAGRVSFSAYPNPAKIAQLSFRLPHRAKVELAVFDVVGRKVAVLANGTFEPGTYTREWNGRGDEGASVGSGLFFYRLRVGGEVLTVRGIRLR